MGIRVLQVTAVDFTVAKFLLPLVRHLTERGCEVTTACTPGDHWESLQATGLRLHPLPIARSMNALAHRRSAKRLLTHLRAERYDVVHVHTPIASLIGRWAAAKAGAPVVLYTAHGFYFHDDMAPWLRRAHVVLERWGAKHHHHLFTQSEEDRQTALRERIATPTTATWIGNGVDIARFALENLSHDAIEKNRTEIGLPTGAPVVMTIARIVREKGLSELVEALGIIQKRIPNAQLVIVGSALASDREDYEGEVRRNLKEHGIGGVHFLGHRTDLENLLPLATVFTLPSWREGMPRSIIEAMAAGKPVVATDIRGCREEVVDGETGFLVPLRDPGALAERLVEIIGEPTLAARMGEAGLARARALFDERLVLERQWRVYRALLAQRGLLSEEQG